MNAFWIILTASLVASCCALLGCYLILRRMALVGDAISHAVLPGIVIAFLLSGSRDSLTMVIGAGLLGVFTTFLIEFFHKKAKLQADASIGVTFTWLFAIGVVLISLYAGKVDLDQDCVLYGEIAYTPLDMISITENLWLPKAVVVMSIVLAVIIVVLIIFYKQLLITSFDPAFASVIGLSVSFWHYLLMAMVSTATVASFESVGAILVVALLIVPPATAYLLTDDFRKMLMIACGVGVLSSIGGYYLAVLIDGSIAAAIASVSGVLFAITLVFSPSHGLLRKKIVQTMN